MVAGLGPCRDAFVGSSPRGDGHAAAGLLGLAAIPFAGLDQRKWSPLYFRCGSIVSSSLDGFTGGAISLGSAVLPRYLCRWGIAGWLEAALELSGTRDIRILHDRCVHDGNDRCSWRLSWSR